MFFIFFFLIFVFSKFSIASTLLTNIVTFSSLFLSQIVPYYPVPITLRFYPYHPVLIILCCTLKKKNLYISSVNSWEQILCLVYIHCSWHIGGIQQVFAQIRTQLIYNFYK